MIRNYRVVAHCLRVLVPLELTGPLNCALCSQLIIARRVSGRTKKYYISSDLSNYDNKIPNSGPKYDLLRYQHTPQKGKPNTPEVDVFENNAAWCGMTQTREVQLGFWERMWRDHKPLVIALGLLALGAGWLVLQEFLDANDDRERLPKNTVRVPEESSDIPSKVPYLIVGGGSTAMSAFEGITSVDRKAQILIISGDSNYPYDRNRLSHQLKISECDDVPDDLFIKPESFYTGVAELMSKNGALAVARGWRVQKVDVRKQTVTLDDGYEVAYDKLLIATGCHKPSLPVFDNASKKVQDRVIVYHDVYDLDELECFIECGAKEIAVVANDFVGCELACFLAERGKKDGFTVHHITPENRIMGNVLPEFLSDYLTKKMICDGVNVKVGKTVSSVSKRGNQVVLKLSNGESVRAEAVVVSAGTVPDVKLADVSGFDVDSRLGGYTVNEQLLGAPNVWMAGDCITILSPPYERQLRLQHHNLGPLTGRLAGENMAGKQKEYSYKPKFWVDLGSDIHCESLGCVDSTFDTVSVFVKCKTEKPPDAPEGCEGEPEEKYKKGIVFYMCRDYIIGMVLWNMCGACEDARMLLEQRKMYCDIDKVSKQLLAKTGS